MTGILRLHSRLTRESGVISRGNKGLLSLLESRRRSLGGYRPRGCKESDTTEQLVLLLWAQLGLLLRPADTGGSRLCSRRHWRGGSQSKGREGIERTKASHESSEPAKDHTPTMPPHPGIKGQVTLKGTVFLALPAASPLQLPSLHRPWNLPLQTQ